MPLFSKHAEIQEPQTPPPREMGVGLGLGQEEEQVPNGAEAASALGSSVVVDGGMSTEATYRWTR